MPLTAGARLGPYEVVSLLGSGGMGEVYRACDTKLNRDVAIKVLPDTVAADPDRLARFHREAQVLAALNHPNIAAIYGFEDANATHALVMELVEGPTLADRIAQGAIPLNEALQIARQIAEALEAAHEQGIIHRDLKPANIKVREDGTVKVLDFGLAKFLEPADAGQAGQTRKAGGLAALTQLPTLTTPAMMTDVGVILGTAAYMSPEQARGKAVDKRADVWAFGCVLYEMLAGQRAFKGEKTVDVLAAALNKEPQWDAVPASTQRLLRKCLEKDPKNRLRDIGDAFALLDDAPRPVARRTQLPWALAALAGVLGAVALWAPWRALPAVERPVTWLDLDLGAVVPPSTVGPTAVLSPDGTRLVGVSQDADGRSRLFTRRLDQSKSVQLAGTEGAYAPFLSPDGQWVGFFAGGEIKKTRVEGGEPVSLGEAPAGRGASWGDDGNIIASLDTRVGLSRISPAGGATTTVTRVDAEHGEASQRWPQVLPGGKAVLYTTSTAGAYYEEASIAVVSLADGRRKVLLEHAGLYGRYLRSGHLAFVKRGTLFAVPFDLGRLEVRGTPSPMAEGLAESPAAGWADFDVAGNGSLLYRTGRSVSLTILQWLDATGKVETLRAQPAVYTYPRLSRDGGRLAVTVANGATTDIWVYDVETARPTRLTQGSDVNSYEAWSPDGRYVVFCSGTGISWTRSDGAGTPQRLFQGKAQLTYPSFARDGQHLVASEMNPDGGSEIRVFPISIEAGQLRAGPPETFLHTQGTSQAAFSPDGHWVAYASTKTGIYEVYARHYPDNGSESPVSANGGLLPIWSPNGRELFYRTDDQRIMVVNYAIKNGEFVSDKPRVWSSTRLANWGNAGNYDLAPDGRRFAVLMPVQDPGAREARNHVTLVLNFFAELRRVVPVKK